MVACGEINLPCGVRVRIDGVPARRAIPETRMEMLGEWRRGLDRFAPVSPLAQKLRGPVCYGVVKDTVPNPAIAPRFFRARSFFLWEKSSTIF